MPENNLTRMTFCSAWVLFWKFPFLLCMTSWFSPNFFSQVCGTSLVRCPIVAPLHDSKPRPLLTLRGNNSSFQPFAQKTLKAVIGCRLYCYPLVFWGIPKIFLKGIFHRTFPFRKENSVFQEKLPFSEREVLNKYQIKTSIDKNALSLGFMYVIFQCER